MGKSSVGDRRTAVEWLCLGLLLLFVAVYVIAYSSKSIAGYATGHTLFDLAVFEQGFWNATKGTLFFYSLEGEMSRFGRHFSPIFLPMVPIYALHRDPSTLLVLQSLALGIAAVPLYSFVRLRLANPVAALLLSAVYLANPAVHDVNIVNEFHEIAFAVPLFFLAFYAIDKRQWRLYAVAILGVLATKEEVALTAAAIGLYVLFIKRERRIGLATLLGSLAWFVVATQLVMPALRGPYGPVPFPGYDYLGEGVFGIAGGIMTRSGELLKVITMDAKQAYLFWLLEPVAFFALLAPEVLLGAAPALLIVLASVYPPTYEIFERYVAPIIPFVFVATAIALGRIRNASRIVGPPEPVRTGIVIGLLLTMVGATLYAQQALNKYPSKLLYPMEPDPHVATAIKFTGAIPEWASVTVEDHRWLARLAHRQSLYNLGWGPNTDYLLLDRKVAPITNVPKEGREEALRRMVESPDYLSLRCEDGFTLYARKDASERDGELFPPYQWEHDRQDDFGGLIRLRGYSLDKTAVRPGDSLIVTLYWQALRQPVGADYMVFVNVLDKQWRSIGQHDGPPQNGDCRTLYWKQGLIVQDLHPITMKPQATPGEYDVRIGLYTLADMKRLHIIGPNGTVVDDNAALPLQVRE